VSRHSDSLADIEAMLNDGIFLETKDPGLGWPGGLAVVHHFSHAADFLLRLLDIANKGMRGVSSMAATEEDRRASAGQAELLSFLFLEPMSNRGLCVIEMVAEAVATQHPLFADDALRLLEGIAISACSGALSCLRTQTADACAPLLRSLAAAVVQSSKAIGTFEVRGVKTILNFVKLDPEPHAALVGCETWLTILHRMRSAPDMYFAPALELMVLAVSHGSPGLQAVVVPELVQHLDLCERSGRNLGWYAPVLYALREHVPLAEFLDGLPAWGSVLLKLAERVAANGGKELGILPADETKRIHSMTRAQKVAEKEAAEQQAAEQLSQAVHASPSEPQQGVEPSQPVSTESPDDPPPPPSSVDVDASQGRPVSTLANLVEQAIAEGQDFGAQSDTVEDAVDVSLQEQTMEDEE
jgi:hypothetical protein